MRERSSLSDELGASLQDRARAFRRHLQAIRTDNLGSPDAFHDALELVDLYAVKLEEHADRKSREQDETEVDRVRTFKEALSDLTTKEGDIDKLFARGGHSSIPRSLSRRIETEFQELPLRDDPRPVLAVGPPGNFEVQIEDFRAYLFDDLWEAQFEGEPRYRSGHFALISVPYLEGTRAFWEPLVVGHEVGHVQVYYRNNLDDVGSSGVRYLDNLLEELALPSEKQPRSWLQEFLCDLNAYRLYGPAAIASVAEMLAVAGGRGNEATDIHPPRSARIALLCSVADLEGDSIAPLYRAIAGSWPKLAEETVEASEPALPLEYLPTFMDGVQILWRSVKNWGARYEFHTRSDRLRWLSDVRLTQGIPCGLASEWRIEVQEEFVPADLINAAWAAESRKTNEEVPIDNLALKGLDNLEFAGLWRRAELRLDPHEVAIHEHDFDVQDDVGTLLSELEAKLDLSDPAFVAIFDAFERLANRPSTGVMSNTDLLSRMSPSRPSHERVVCTPLLPGALREASLDIRLSSSFIVFKHSATEVFDAISGGQDPREMQESVEKEWGARFILHPNELVLASTLEYIVLPGDVVAEVASRSSYGRLGLLSVTASKVQPWSIGCITLELVNTSQTPIALTVGERIAQVIFQGLPRAVPRLSQTYRWPTGPEFSRVRADWDRPVLRGVRDILAGKVAAVDAQRADRMMRAGAQMLDVRLDDEFEAGNIAGSVHVPFSRLSDLVRASVFPSQAPRPDVDDVGQLERGLPIVTLSRGGSRAERAASYLMRWGFDVFYLDGGLTAWRDRRLPLETVRGDPGTVI